jgi:hypothetical protein
MCLSIRRQRTRGRADSLKNAAAPATLHDRLLVQATLQLISKEGICPVKSFSQVRHITLKSNSIHMASTPASSGQPNATLSSAGGKRVLCALDASEHSVQALRFALDKIVTPEKGDKIILFQAAEPIRSERP